MDKKYSINSELEAKEKFILAANKIKFYQAVRHTMGKMRTGETNFGTKWTEKSGILPDKLDETYCKNKALEKIVFAKTLTNTWDERGFNDIYNTFIEKFNADTFINNLKFLIYFQGKDFASSLKLEMPDFPLKQYYKFAKENFNYQDFPDLKQLRLLIESKL